jgi:hypothetical protein
MHTETSVLVLCDLKESCPDCSETLVACWTTCCVKGFLSFNRLAFTHDNLKAVQGLDVWKICLAPCLQNLWFISMKKLATFGYVVGAFLP